MAIENRLEALVLRAFSASNVCFARNEPSLTRVGIVEPRPSLITPFLDPKMNVLGSQNRFAYNILKT